MKMLAFASRNAKEILRDKLNLAFGIGFPVILLLLLTAIQKNIPIPLFDLTQLTPGIAVFGLSFISLSSGMLIAKDRSSSFMLRLFTSPLSAVDFLLGYMLPLLPMAIAQIAICFGVAMVLGLSPTIHILTAILAIIPTAVLFIAIGLLCGSLFTDKQVGGICGALLTNLTGWLSGTWFDIDLVGEGFRSVANMLPFVHAVDAGRVALAGEVGAIFPAMWWVIGYAILFMVFAVWVFTIRMKGDNA